MILQGGKLPSEREALTAAKHSVLTWVNDEERKIGFESGLKRLNIIKSTWNGLEWYIWIQCNANKFTTRVFYYVYYPDREMGHLTPFVPIGTFHEKEGVVDDKQNERK